MDPPKDSYGAWHRRRRWIFCAAVLIAAVVISLMPTPNRTYGGAMKMLIMILLTVALKALFEWLWLRKRD